MFRVPKGATVKDSDREKAERLGYKGDYTRLGNSCWYTNIEHGRRHEPLSLMSMQQNLKFSRHKEIKEKGYLHYDNYDAIEVPYTDAIPNDYKGVMGVPISFLDKYCPEQFEILGISLELATTKPADLPKAKQGGPAFYIKENGEYQRLYCRIVIKAKG